MRAEALRIEHREAQDARPSPVGPRGTASRADLAKPGGPRCHLDNGIAFPSMLLYSIHMYHTCLLTLTASDAPFRRVALLCASASALCASSIECSWPRPALCLHCIEWTAPPPALSTQCTSSVWHLILNASILCGMATRGDQTECGGQDPGSFL